MGPYGKYLRQAFEITRLYKTLWLTGLFLILFEVGSFIFTTWIDSKREANITPTMLQIALLLIILLSIIMYRAKAAVIINIKSITDKKPLTIGRGWSNARL